jgi:hypothetical protein
MRALSLKQRGRPQPMAAPPRRTQAISLEGGLDLATSLLTIPPGRAIEASNYEIPATGGYRRMYGIERFDGRPKPSDAVATVLGAVSALDASLAVGDTLNGQTSGATGKVIEIGVDRLYVVLTRTTGAFEAGENLREGTTVVGVHGEVPSSLTSFDYNRFAALAAADYRTDIQAPTGSGRVRGVWEYGGNVYCIRNNAGGTAAGMFKSSATGWQSVALGLELYFDAGNTSTAIAAGQTVTGGTSGASGVVTRVVVQSGDPTFPPGDPAVGKLIFASITGTFQDNEELRVSGVRRADANGTQAAITLAADGNYEFVTHNFFGATGTRRMYGVSGTHRGFEFDGTVFVPIDTGMSPDTPEHIAVHKEHLVFTFGPSVQHSAPGEPYVWSVVLGAGELSTGDDVTGLAQGPGTENTAALAIFCTNKTSVLYGSDVTDWVLNVFSERVGARAGTVRRVTQPIYLDDLGFTTLAAAQSFGNFADSVISAAIKPLLTEKIDLATTSVVNRRESQYRVFFNDGSGFIATLRGGKVVGWMPFYYPIIVRCACDTELGGGQMFVGADDGYVYQLDRGRSFDGQAIDARLRLPYTHDRMPSVRKRYHGARFDAELSGASQVSIGYLVSRNDAGVDSSPVVESDIDGGSDGLGDPLTGLDEMALDGDQYSSFDVDLDVSGTDISLFINSARDDELPHTLRSVQIQYTVRRIRRL